MDLFNQTDEIILSVSEITDSVKKLLEKSFAGIKIVGEISNFKALIENYNASKIAIFSENRAEWIYSLYSSWLCHSTVVPIDFMSSSLLKLILSV